MSWQMNMNFYLSPLSLLAVTYKNLQQNYEAAQHERMGLINTAPPFYYEYNFNK